MQGAVCSTVQWCAVCTSLCSVQCAVCSTVMCSVQYSTPSAKSVAIGTGANNDLATAGQEGRDPQGTCSHVTDIESGPQETSLTNLPCWS